VPLKSRHDAPLPTSGFREIGRRVEVLSGFRAELVLTASGAAELRWFKPGGDEQKSIPALVKRAHDAEVRSLQTAVKEVERTPATAREQLEYAPLDRRSWSAHDWRERYLDHPVAATIGRLVL
jgi:Domain of unknown function (DUF4132)